MAVIMWDFSMFKKNKHGIATIIGGFLIHLTLGNLYSFGNIMTYMDSYMHIRVDKHVTYSNFIWVNAVATASQGVFMAIGGLLEKKIGPIPTCFLGSLILSSGIGLTFFSIKSSFAAVILTYGLMVGLGIALAYAIPLACGMKWFPNRKGFVTGVIVGGFGLGSFGSTILQTHYLNPMNIAINATSGYFEDPRILNKVPSVFLLLGGIFFVMQVISCLLITPKKPTLNFTDETEDEHLLNNMGERYLDLSEPTDCRIMGRDLSAQEAIRTKVFAIFWSIFLLNSIAIGYINAMYKSFGQTFIHDDFFLARVGAFAAIFNFCGRLAWGRLMDSTSFKTSMTLMTLGLSILYMTLPLTIYMGKFAFALWIWGIFFCFSGTFVLISTVTEKAFGSSNYTSIYGLIFTQQLFASIILSCINQFLLVYGFSVCFITIGVIVIGSTVLTVILPAKL